MKKIARNFLFAFLTIIITANVIILNTKNATAEAQDVKVPILVYHHIMYNYNPENALINISPDELLLHLWALKNDGFTTITFDDYYDYVQGVRALPEKPIIISFDDGYLSNYEYGYKMLKSLGMKATIFVITSTVGATENVTYPHFTWEQAKEMEKSGVIDIQSHSHSHREMGNLDAVSIQRELRLSKYLIEQNLNKEVSVFAYPFGSFGALTQSLATFAGYKIQCKVGDLGYNTKTSPQNELKRITVSGTTTDHGLIDQINTNLELPN